MLPRTGRRQQALPAGSAANVTKLISACVACVMVVYFIWMQRALTPTTPAALRENAAQFEVLPVSTTPIAPPRSWKRKPGRRYVWLDVAVDGKSIGRVTAELYMDIVPKTAENFRGLVTGDNAAGFTYKGATCHRIIKDFVVQCGDWETGKGYGGKSIYGGKFDDEPAGLKLEHSKRYILQMANSGPNTNGSQFCFMLKATPHLNGHHVVFGEVVEGFSVVDAMEAAGVDQDGVNLSHTVVVLYGCFMYSIISHESPPRSPYSAELEEQKELDLPVVTLAARPWTRKAGRRYVWIDVEIDGVPTGRVTAELYMDIVPKTAENFRGLVTGDNARGYSYKNSKCHRILANFVVQCGDWEYGAGTGGKSIYGGDFEDETAGLKLKHDKRYVLQMANAGPNTNGAQFCFMLSPQPHLNGHHVVFGQVVDGFAVVDAMEAAGVSGDGDRLEKSSTPLVISCILLLCIFTMKIAIEANMSTTRLERLDGAESVALVSLLDPTRYQWTRKPGRRYVWLDVSIDSVFAGRVTMELFMDLVPKTAENFRGLVTGDNTKGLSYRNSTCHRILKGFIVQCGGVESATGGAGSSIYPEGRFDDEKEGLKLKHDKRYLLHMANPVPNSNGSQFGIMLHAAPGLDGHHVVFGQVIHGFSVVDAMEDAGVKRDNEPLQHTIRFPPMQ
ncbi:peptidyl-prolyl cis-trans isomerase C [Achlya hypogyna]|uniref:peptidylprolyl isomerase n=1 Tax=Achlya hypogyna TaxID=1202772 RepID=A0A1V9ZLF3_ACHHY|nr:peptidyl-prolyl cis-trans isomerase C [Achlya hypogyna]